jgi:hypothetical protein
MAFFMKHSPPLVHHLKVCEAEPWISLLARITTFLRL